jgi:hypothetical protein
MELNRRAFVTGLVGVTCAGLAWACRRTSRSVSREKTFVGRLPSDRRDALGAMVNCVLPGATDAGALDYIDYWFTRPPLDSFQHQFDLACVLVNRAAGKRHGKAFSRCAAPEQDAILRELRLGTLHPKFDGKSFFERLITITIESFLGDPKYGGNRDRVGWRFIGWEPCWWSPKRVHTLLAGDARLLY